MTEVHDRASIAAAAETLDWGVLIEEHPGGEVSVYLEGLDRPAAIKLLWIALKTLTPGVEKKADPTARWLSPALDPPGSGPAGF